MQDGKGTTRVLLAEHDATMVPLCHAALQRVFGTVRVDHARGHEEAVELLRTHRYDLVLADHHLGSRRTGLDVLERATWEAPGATRVLMSGRADARLALEALRHVRVHGFLAKPGTAATLAEGLSRIMARG